MIGGQVDLLVDMSVTAVGLRFWSVAGSVAAIQNRLEWGEKRGDASCVTTSSPPWTGTRHKTVFFSHLFGGFGGSFQLKRIRTSFI